MNVLSICGSLRKTSSNAAVLEAAGRPIGAPSAATSMTIIDALSGASPSWLVSAFQSRAGSSLRRATAPDRTMSARLVEPASITLPLMGTGLDADGIVGDERFAAPLSEALGSAAPGVMRF